MLGSGKGSDVAKKGGEMWKSLSDSDRKPYEKKAKEQKDAYDAFIATEEGQKALSSKKSAQADAKAEKNQKAEAKAEKLAAKEEKRNERACKAAVKSVEKDESLKKPQSAYWLWLADNREKIVKELGSAKGPDVAKKGGEMWKALSEIARKPYEKKATEQKEAYDKYIASEEGAAKLKAFKDATQAAKDQFKPKEDPECEVAEEVAPKRKVKDVAAENDEATPAQKKSRGRPPKVQAGMLGA
jgi:hypothetical protein